MQFCNPRLWNYFQERETIPHECDRPSQLPSSQIILQDNFSPIMFPIQLKVISVPSGKLKKKPSNIIMQDTERRYLDSFHQSDSKS